MALGHFLLGQSRQILVIAQVVAGSIFGPLTILLPEGGQTQRFEMAFKQQVGFHLALLSTGDRNAPDAAAVVRRSPIWDGHSNPA